MLLLFDLGFICSSYRVFHRTCTKLKRSHFETRALNESKFSAVTKNGIKDLNYFLIETLKDIPKIEISEVKEDDKSFKWDDYHENILDEKNNEDDFDDWNEDDYDVKVFYKP